MSLPSSGNPLSMSQINSEAGFSSTQANSSTQQRTFDYSVAGVDQNQPYSFSEFYSKAFSYGNSITLYYYYPFDGGNSPNNFAIWGWYAQSSALTHNGYGGSTYTHTCYYNGSLGNGTNLYTNTGVAGTALYPMIDAGYNDVYPYGGTGAWYYLTDGTNSYTCQSAYTDIYGSPTSHTFQISNLTSAASCTISGGVSISPSISSVTGTITITGTKSVRLSCFGGASSGNSFACTINIASVGTYNLSCTAFQTKNQDISLSAGTYSYYLFRNSYSGASGNNASISCL